MEQKKKIGMSIILFFMSVIFLTAFTSAYDWGTYGSNTIYMPQSQLSTINGYFNETYSTIAIAQGATNSPSQPLISQLNNPNDYYMIVQNGNYLQLYDESFTLVNELSTGQVLGTLDVIDANGDGNNEIAGIYSLGSGYYDFRVYQYNYASNIMSLFNNFSFYEPTNFTSTGVRCLSYSVNTCFTLYDTNNGTGYTRYFQSFNITTNTTTGFLLGYSIAPTKEVVQWQDYNNDGINEFISVSNDRAFVFSQTGNMLFQATNSSTERRIANVKFFHPDSSNLWKVAVIYESTCGNPLDRCLKLNTYKTDNSSFYSVSQSLIGSFANVDMSVFGVAIGDYNNDIYDDIYIASYEEGGGSPPPQYNSITIFKGLDGSIFHYNRTAKTVSPSTHLVDAEYPSASLTLARMNQDSFPELIITSLNRTRVYDPITTKSIYLSQSVPSYAKQCVPADLLFNGDLSIVCSGSGNSQAYFSSYTNTNPTINSLTLDPSAFLIIGQTLNVLISATDVDGNLIRYFVDCGNGVNTTEDYSNFKSCSYESVGSFDLVVYVRDDFHSTYNQFNVTILVTETGETCNLNLVCEAELGETTSNCPSDCVSGGGSIGGEDGTLEIPIQLVDTTQTYAVGEERGLLPSIYYGTLGFLSHSLAPIFLLVFVIFVVLIMFAIGTIVKKLFVKVTS